MTEAFRLERTRGGLWTLRDGETGIEVVFSEHRYNRPQSVNVPGSGIGFMRAARTLRRMGEWILENHRDIAL